jgi:hypothetical protein
VQQHSVPRLGAGPQCCDIKDIVGWLLQKICVQVAILYIPFAFPFNITKKKESRVFSFVFVLFPFFLFSYYTASARALTSRQQLFFFYRNEKEKEKKTFYFFKIFFSPFLLPN